MNHEVTRHEDFVLRAFVTRGSRTYASRLSWLRDFVDVTASADEIAETLALRGFEVASIEPLDAGDAVIDFEVTANRPDCLSVVGLAREVATAYDLPLRAGARRTRRRVDVPAGESDRVHGRHRGRRALPAVRGGGRGRRRRRRASPAWMSAPPAGGRRPAHQPHRRHHELRAARARPADARVRPRHARRPRRSACGARRRARSITTLDGVERTLEPDMLVIADRDRAQAVAGVMGGAASEVSASTRAIVFESAYFKPASVRRTSKRLGLKTEASSRFERGADINAPVVALQRAIALMEQIGAGTGRPARSSTGTRRVVQPARLHLRRARLASAARRRRPRRATSSASCAASASTSTGAADGWDVDRADLPRRSAARGRSHRGGRPALRLRPARGDLPAAHRSRRRRPIRASRATGSVRRVLTAAGLSEAVTFGFIESKAAAPFATGRRGHRRHREPAVGEVRHAAAVAAARASSTPSRTTAGTAAATSRSSKSARASRRAARPAASRIAWTGAAGRTLVGRRARRGLLRRQGRRRTPVPRRSAWRPVFASRSRRFWSPGHAAAIAAGATPLGVLGQLAPAIADGRGAPRQDAIFVAELDLDAAWAARTARDDAVQPLPRHPFVVRDLSIVVADALPAEIIRGTIQAAGASAPAPLVSVRVLRSVLRARACRTAGQPVGAADVPGGRSHADRRRGAAERRRRFWRRSCASTARC